MTCTDLKIFNELIKEYNSTEISDVTFQLSTPLIARLHEHLQLLTVKMTAVKELASPRQKAECVLWFN
jgi:uncharacterized coiled-coil protein SlyX